MDIVGLRAEFRSYIGEERYRRFVRNVNTINRAHVRMRYWQETAWRGFIGLHPEWSMPFESIQQCFQICEVHGGELVQGPTPIWYGYFHDEFINAYYESFPWAMIVCTPGISWFRQGDPTFFCAECREAAKPWHRVRAVMKPRNLPEG